MEEPMPRITEIQNLPPDTLLVILDAAERSLRNRRQRTKDRDMKHVLFMAELNARAQLNKRLYAEKER
tara:strand:- start:1227 stop:1430 length:204 start_codon:yes stop_codon:yes gene_type:complete